MTPFRMDLPVSKSLLAYFEQVQKERQYHHDRKQTVKEKAERKKGKARKYSHKVESTSKDRIHEYQVIGLHSSNNTSRNWCAQIVEYTSAKTDKDGWMCTEKHALPKRTG